MRVGIEERKLRWCEDPDPPGDAAGGHLRIGQGVLDPDNAVPAPDDHGCLFLGTVRERRADRNPHGFAVALDMDVEQDR